MSTTAFKRIAYVGGVLGLTLFIVLIVRTDLGRICQALALGGWPLFWLLPYRLIFFVLYALAWEVLLRPYDPRGRLGVAYLTWVAMVREAVDRLLPVASVGGGVAGVRLLGWRGIDASAAAATVIVEVLLTLVVLWAFAVLGLSLLAMQSLQAPRFGSAALVVTAGLAVPVALGLLLSYGAVFRHLGAALGGMVGVRALAARAATLDEEVRATLRRGHSVVICAVLQLLAMLSGAFEVWFSLRLFGHPVDFRAAMIMESLMQAARHVAFLVPGALGIQEFSLVFVGNVVGVSADLALAVSLVKRARELIWGIPALACWQWEEGRRLHRTQGEAS